MGWFGPSKDEACQQLSEEIGAEFVEDGFWKGNKVQMHVMDWTITLDTYSESNGVSSIAYTRMRAPYINREGFRFKIDRECILSWLGKLLGMQDIEVGDLAAIRVSSTKGEPLACILALQVHYLSEPRPWCKLLTSHSGNHPFVVRKIRHSIP